MKYFRFLYIALLGVSSSLCALNRVDEVQTHILMKDFHRALDLCKGALEEQQDSLELKKLHIQILASMDLDVEALQCWKTYFLDQAIDDYELIETLGWSVLSASSKKKNPQLNSMLLSGAFVIDDIRAVKMLVHHLESPNSFIRAMALQLSVRYPDEVVIAKIRHMVQKERVWFVKLEAIKALGMMQVEGSRACLRKIITEGSRLDEEKHAAVVALVSSYGQVCQDEVQELVYSKRMGLRCLGCNIIGFTDQQKSRGELLSLLEDSSPQVRVAALNNLYLLGISGLSTSELDRVSTLCDDPNPEVSVIASWMLAPYCQQKSIAALQCWMQSSRQQVRCMAAYFLAKIGKGAKREVLMSLKNQLDPFVKLNIALGMLGTGIDDRVALDEVALFLKTTQKKVMHFTPPFSLCSLVVPSKVRHTPEVPRYPNMVDSMTRLELLNILASLDYEGAKESMKTFLKSNMLGISFTAANLLISIEGQRALDIVRQFLTDEDQQLRLQAAIVLCANAEGGMALDTLHALFHEVPRALQVEILQAIGSVGEKRSIPFLMTLLEEPYASIRMLASAAMIRCAYH